MTMKSIIFKIGLLAGILDILAACIQSYLMANVMPSTVLKYIASGVFGKSAFTGGFGMQVWGLLFHFVIAFACTASYFVLYPKITFLKKNWLVNAVLIALVAWVVTNLIIIPMSKIPNHPFSFSKALIALIILIFSIGLPISFFAKKFYDRQKNVSK